MSRTERLVAFLALSFAVVLGLRQVYQSSFEVLADASAWRNSVRGGDYAALDRSFTEADAQGSLVQTVLRRAFTHALSSNFTNRDKVLAGLAFEFTAVARDPQGHCPSPAAAPDWKTLAPLTPVGLCALAYRLTSTDRRTHALMAVRIESGGAARAFVSPYRNWDSGVAGSIALDLSGARPQPTRVTLIAVVGTRPSIGATDWLQAPVRAAATSADIAALRARVERLGLVLISAEQPMR